MNKFLWIFLFCQIIVNLSASRGPKVCIPDGCVMGNSRSEGYDEFLGIPYAKPPIDDLRFKNPVPVESWGSTVLDVTTARNDCIQKNVLLAGAIISGDEDCLYLNVYRPTLKTKNDPKLPVIIYIHGGGWFAGTPGPFINGPEYFMETRKVVLVLMAYRLGALGFLSTGDDAISGNFGLKDQALAIEWTYKNIENFGGDPDLMTCAGQSAGAGSCHMHMFNPNVAQRISRVILMSGSAIAPWAYVEQNPKAMAQLFAEKAGIEDSTSLSSQQLAEELFKIDAVEMVKAHEAMKLWDVDPLVVFHPVIENCVDGAFLCADQVKSWAQCNYTAIPILIGNTAVEGGVRALKVIEDPALVSSINKNFEYLNKIFFLLNSSYTGQKDMIFQKFKKVYYKGLNKLNAHNKFGLVDAYSDRYFIQPVLKTVKLFTQCNKDPSVPIYVYKFDFKGPKSYSKLFVGNNKYYGPIHCDELLYTFKSPIFGSFADNSLETKFRKYWINFLITFAETGELKNHQKCRVFSERYPKSCPYTYFYRETQNSSTYNITTRHDLPMRVVPFMEQIEGFSGPQYKCNILSRQKCCNKYCC